MADEPRRFEPWPWVLAALLGAMIVASLAFWRIAVTNPDPLVVDDMRALYTDPVGAGPAVDDAREP